MKIEIGEYVRTKNGKIYKVINNNYYMPQYIECEKGIVDKENIVNHSKIISEVVEVGDYVNGYKVIAKSDDGYIEILTDDIEQGELLEEQDIKTILTKEQYQENCYTVERKSKE